MANTKSGAFDISANLRSLFVPAHSTIRPLDGLRVLALLWMLIVHTYVFLAAYLSREEFYRLSTDPWLRGVTNGDVALDVFFVISGFLIGSILLEELDVRGTISLPRFYARRALRLLPVYYLVLAFYCVIRAPNYENVWANLSFVNNFLPINRQCMGWTWSIAVEEQFYFCLPAILIVLGRASPRTRFWVTMGFGAIAVVLPLAVAFHGRITLPVDQYGLRDPVAFGGKLDFIYESPFCRFGPFLIGVLTLHLHREGSLARWLAARPVRASALALLAAFVLFATTAAGARDPSYVSASFTLDAIFLSQGRHVFALAIAYLLFLGLNRIGGVGRAIGGFLSLRVFHPLAQLSYSAYLIHAFCIYGVYDRFRPVVAPTYAALAGYALLVMTASFVLATPLYLLVERPFMNLRKRLFRVPTTGHVEAPPRIARIAGKEAV